MAILFDKTLVFDNLSELLAGRNTFQLVLQNGINQSLCDLHIATQNNLGIPPQISTVKVQTTFESKTLVSSPPAISLDVDFQTLFDSKQCIPFGTPSSIFFLTFTFTRTFLPGDTLLISPSNSLGTLVIA